MWEFTYYLDKNKMEDITHEILAETLKSKNSRGNRFYNFYLRLKYLGLKAYSFSSISDINDNIENLGKKLWYPRTGVVYGYCNFPVNVSSNGYVHNFSDSTGEIGAFSMLQEINEALANRRNLSGFIFGDFIVDHKLEYFELFRKIVVYHIDDDKGSDFWSDSIPPDTIDLIYRYRRLPKNKHSETLESLMISS